MWSYHHVIWPSTYFTILLFYHYVILPSCYLTKLFYHHVILPLSYLKMCMIPELKQQYCSVCVCVCVCIRCVPNQNLLWMYKFTFLFFLPIPNKPYGFCGRYLDIRLLIYLLLLLLLLVSRLLQNKPRFAWSWLCEQQRQPMKSWRTIQCHLHRRGQPVRWADRSLLMRWPALSQTPLPHLCSSLTAPLKR